MKEFLVMLLCVTSVIAITQGAIEATKSSTCVYNSVVSYHPARILSCELFKKRWRNGRK